MWIALVTGLVLVWSCQDPVGDDLQPSTVPVEIEPTSTITRNQNQEQAPIPIALVGEISVPEAEISGLAWYENVLVLVPQYPDRHGHSLFGITRQTLEKTLSSADPEPVEPFLIPLANGSELEDLNGYEGLEALVFSGSRFYVAVEAQDKGAMLGYLVPGTVEGDLDQLQLDLDSTIVLPPQTSHMNKSYETLVLHGSSVIAIHELAGRDANPQRYALHFSAELNSLGNLDMPEIEYRITDATSLDQHGRFWVANFHWPGEKQLPVEFDGIRNQWGEGASHQAVEFVERLVELELREREIVLVKRPPIELELLDEVVARNWEGIARWTDLGLLIVTDRFPTTLLAYVPFPSDE